MRSIGTMRLDQLLKFFRSTDDARNLEYYIKELVGAHVLEYDKGTNEVTYRDSIHQNRDPIVRRIIAFWVLAYMGYDNIQEMYALRYPSQILFITETNEVYDLSVCVTADEGALANRLRDLHTVSDSIDDVNHIAIVQNHEVGQEILQYGFDSYCIFGEDKVPQYYTP